MWHPNYSICVNCERERLIVVKKGLCKACNEVFKNKPIPRIKRSRLEPDKRLKLAKGILTKFKFKKAMGELAFFKDEWGKREHISEVSGTYLGENMDIRFMSHLLTKGAFPAFRLNPDNLCLMTIEEHQEWEFKSRENKKWDKIKERCQILKQQYYANKIQ